MHHPTIRTRIAPSPTGDPHIGTAYIALFNYVFARRHGGRFLLRIEDTDRVRSTPESERAILAALRWIGLAWDEGPDVGGPHGPYRQSERTEIYRAHCERLIDSGHAYYCFATPEQLDAYRRERLQAGKATGYDGSFGMWTRAEARARIAAGDPHVIRLKAPAEGECVIHDRLRGAIRIPWENVDHQVLLKADGHPTYHLASVVDDHLMEITHVIRGEEWINSAPKHKLLYEAFGWEMPELIHMPLLRNPDRSKLSKRKNPTSIDYYRQAGYLPEALLNYLGLMAWTYPPAPGETEGPEMFSLEEMIAAFDIDRVSLGGPIFDPRKLNWLNGRYLREKHDPAALLARLRDWMLNDGVWLRALPLVQPRAEKLSDVVPMTAFLFADRPAYDPHSLIQKKLDGDAAARLLRIALWELERVTPWNKETTKAAISRIAQIEGLKLRELMPVLFVALTGAPASLPLFDSMEILGAAMSRRRLVYALEALGSIGHELSSRQLKAIEQEYREKYLEQGKGETQAAGDGADGSGAEG
ncbi:MAG: Glutamate--tRNA ligase [candidate division BRC1 bacterium ADurb.BinA292]|nr:MAG: Glutamate--tRNA ligase [candidate division BRC1 bacterium ADurb.BinA292]